MLSPLLIATSPAARLDLFFIWPNPTFVLAPFKKLYHPEKSSVDFLPPFVTSDRIPNFSFNPAMLTKPLVPFS